MFPDLGPAIRLLFVLAMIGLAFLLIAVPAFVWWLATHVQIGWRT